MLNEWHTFQQSCHSWSLPSVPFGVLFCVYLWLWHLIFHKLQEAFKVFFQKKKKKKLLLVFKHPPLFVHMPFPAKTSCKINSPLWLLFFYFYFWRDVLPPSWWLLLVDWAPLWSLTRYVNIVCSSDLLLVYTFCMCVCVDISILTAALTTKHCLSQFEQMCETSVLPHNLIFAIMCLSYFAVTNGHLLAANKRRFFIVPLRGISICNHCYILVWMMVLHNGSTLPWRGCGWFAVL